MAFKIRPEITKGKYWLHLLFITLIVEILQIFATLLIYQEPIKFNSAFLVVLSVNMLASLIFFGIADIIVHTVLKLD